jgi:sodium/hydrogen antiporter
MDPYVVLLVFVGVAIIAAAMLPRVLARAPLSLPIIYLAAGLVLFALPIGLRGPRLGADDELAERLAELVVIVSIMGSGLKLDRRIGLHRWGTTWRLLGVAMPLTIAAIALLAGGPLGLPVASAVLLGAVLAPTDPVLASDVQLDGPNGGNESDEDGDAEGEVDRRERDDDGEEGKGEDDEDEGDEDEGDEDENDEDENDEVRFALTSEASLNDALAFPFTNLAIAIAAGGSWLADWLVEDVVVKLVVGVVAGWVLGRAVAWLAFHFESETALARTSEGFVALGATLAVYGITELAHGYGFLAVFVAAVTVRSQERDHAYHQVLHDYAESTERLASIVFLLLLGGAIVEGALAALTIPGAVVAGLIVLVIRPLAGWLALLGSPTPRRERAAIAFFGIRGVGTIYYLAHAATEERFEGAAEVWAVAVLVIIISIVLHGMTASHALRWLRAKSG